MAGRELRDIYLTTSRKATFRERSTIEVENKTTNEKISLG